MIIERCLTMSTAKIQRNSLVDLTIGNLRQAVEAGTWQVGERIPTEPALVIQLGVGRNTVREAVRVLVHTGMLETRQGDGTYVRAQFDSAEALRRLDRADLRDRLEVRLTLEVEAARLAALRRDRRDLAAMHKALKARAAASSNINERIEHDECFHRAVVEAAHNRAFSGLYCYFAMAIRNTIERTESDADLPEPSQADHQRLFDAIERADAGAAAAAARSLLTPPLDALLGA